MEEDRKAPEYGALQGGVRSPYPKAAVAWYAIAMLGLINALDSIDRGILSLLIQPIKRDLGLSDTEIGLLSGIAFSGVYAMVGLPLSRLADTRNRKLILSFGITLWSAATALGSLAQNFWHLFLSRAGTGAGESLKGPNALSMISDLVPREKLARAMSLYSMGIVGGMAFSLIAGGMLLGHFEGRDIAGPFGILFRDWQIVLLLVGSPGIVVALIFLLTVREPARRGRRSADKPPLLEVLRFIRGNFRFFGFFLAGVALLQIELTGLLHWRIPFYERTYGWGPATAGPLMGTISLVTTPVGLAIGAWLGERLARRGDPGAMLRLSLIGLTSALPFAVVQPLMPTPQLAMACSAVSLLCSSIASPGYVAAIQVVTPNEFRGQVNAIYLFMISVVGSAIAPLAVSLITDYVFGDEAMLRYSMVTIAIIFGTAGLAMKYLSLRPYCAMVSRIMEEERQAGRAP
ncbi:MFS transporter [Altererythrobacter fulvus]|uniref:spinster family MFS transporter n=1 Tax=Caenibius fulvus TaxID=2126012 RepID=UPI00301B2D46